MYKVCFVDDESRNHRVMESLVDWAGKGFVPAGTATDGQEALELFQRIRPDLMLIDIKMPVMDGLECIRRIRALSTSVKLVLVTAFSEFEYAQKAIGMGVEGYLLKPVSRAALGEIVEKIAADLVLEREQAASLSAMRNESYIAGLSLALQELLSSNKCAGYSQTDSLFRRPLSLLDVHLRDAADAQRIREHVLRWLEGVQAPPVVSLRPSFFRMVIVCPYCTRLSAEIPHWLEILKQESLRCDIYLQEEPLRAGNLALIRERLHDSADRCFYSEGGTWSGLLSPLPPCGSTPIFANAPDRISSALSDLTPTALQAYIGNELDRAKEHRLPPRAVKERCFDLLALLKISIRAISPSDTFELLRGVRLEELLAINRCSQLAFYMNQTLDGVFLQLNEQEHQCGRGVSLALKANAYACAHFSRRNFSVQQVAEHIGISKNYFTKIYKEVTGSGFWDYVTALRMERARRLLQNTDDTVSAIAGAVGYESEYHFSRKFKGITGHTPNQFRKGGSAAKDFNRE